MEVIDKSNESDETRFGGVVSFDPARAASAAIRCLVTLQSRRRGQVTDFRQRRHKDGSVASRLPGRRTPGSNCLRSQPVTREREQSR